MPKIPSMSADTKAAIRRKSADVLPDDPSASGWKPVDIRRALVAPLLDSDASALAEIDRVIDDVNSVLDSGLPSIDVLTECPDGSLSGSSGFVYSLSGERLYISSCSAYWEEMFIPSSCVLGDKVYPVYGISSGALQSPQLKALHIPSSVCLLSEGAIRVRLSPFHLYFDDLPKYLSSGAVSGYYQTNTDGSVTQSTVILHVPDRSLSEFASSVGTAFTVGTFTLSAYTTPEGNASRIASLEQKARYRLGSGDDGLIHLYYESEDL